MLVRARDVVAARKAADGDSAALEELYQRYGGSCYGLARRMLRDLPPEQREVLLLAYYGGYSQREISSITGVALGTVKSRTLGAMRRLRVELGPRVADTRGND